MCLANGDKYLVVLAALDSLECVYVCVCGRPRLTPRVRLEINPSPTSSQHLKRHTYGSQVGDFSCPSVLDLRSQYLVHL